ncbi:MAG: hypothetical protein JO020_19730 [Chloroflexi bacterium]|nr:hypothetical protein [Chloroflexota bacterium]MBV9896401.1 hypothetical protein [Chloroflexota bacterium]
MLEELVFGAEVVGDRALADVRALGDMRQRGLGVALARERLDPSTTVQYTAGPTPMGGCKTTPACRAQADAAAHSAGMYAVLPSGERLVPGKTAGCPGPDAYGACPHAEQGKPLPCAGATWYSPGPRGWQFTFQSDSSVCPVTVLDPLGPLAVPSD